MLRKRVTAFAMVAALATATTLSIPAQQAQAKDGRNGAFAAGAITGLVAGAIANEALREGDPAPRPPHKVRKDHRFEPWTARWRHDCERRYRSFNPRTGYYMGYDGRRHFCR